MTRDLIRNRTFTINSVTVSYDLKYYFQNPKILNEFMQAVKKFCKSHPEMVQRVQEQNNAKVSRILQSIKPEEMTDFNNTVSHFMFDKGWLKHYLFLIFSCVKNQELRLSIVEYWWQNWEKLAKKYFVGVLHDSADRYNKIQERYLNKAEKELRQKIQQEIRQMRTASDARVAKIGVDADWKLDQNKEFATDSVSNLEDFFKPSDKKVRLIVQDAIDRNKFSIIRIQYLLHKGRGFADSLTTWLEEHGIIKINPGKQSESIVMQVHSMEEFDNIFKPML